MKIFLAKRSTKSLLYITYLIKIDKKGGVRFLLILTIISLIEADMLQVGLAILFDNLICLSLKDKKKLIVKMN